MKKIHFAIALSCFLFGCNRKADNPQPAPTEITTDSVIMPAAPTAKNSLDYLGLYKGKLPCADCAAIETALQLSEDFSYLLTRKYLGKSTKSVEQKGTFSWNEAGNAIVLDNTKDEPNQYLVGENTLTQLDMQGQKIVGKLAGNYILKKMTEAQAAKTDALPEKKTAIKINGIHWQLTELNGKPVKSKGEKDYSIEFKTDGRFGAFAGCNSIGGQYELKGSSIKLFRIMSTMMACEEMRVEDQFRKSIEAVDNFVANENLLQLRKGGTTLIQFEAVKTK